MRQDYSVPGNLPGVLSELFLEVDNPEDNIIPRVPVTLLDVVEGIATLKISQRQAGWEPSALRGKTANLYLSLGDQGDPQLIRGTVLWARNGDARDPSLLLGVLLPQEYPVARQLEAQVSRRYCDLEGLWHLYDQLQEAPEASPWFQTLNYVGQGFIIMSLPLCFMSPPLRLVSVILMGLGGLLILGKYHWCDRKKKSSRP
jgi:hypothetical protein